ncbi:MAG TPA: sulfotransferase [Candidatus Krumholzibacteria bacterium]
MPSPVTVEPISFLLGCERSGSTWLANILDAHEGVELMMEPFAPHARLFAEFPPRHVHIAQSSAGLEEMVRRGLPATLPRKYSLLYRPGRPARLRAIDAALVREFRRVHRRLRLTPPLSSLQWELLNLNLSEIPTHLRARKQWPPVHYAVKELRLNLKVPVLRGAFPEARYVVIVRNPAAQLTSIRRWFEQGRLGELAASLKTLADHTLRSPELERYRPWLGSSDRDDLLVAWWFINYETLIGDLERTGAKMLLIRHEEMSAEPEAGARALFEFLGLPPSRSAAGFVSASSGAEPRTSSPVDTFRKSADHSRDSIRGADRSLADRLRRMADGLPCRDDLRVYFP